MAYVQKNNPFPVTSCGRRRTFMNNNAMKAVNTPGDDRTKESPFPKRKKSNEPRKTTKGKGRNFRTVEEGAGMTKKGVAEYRRKNPGSKLKTAVTGKVKKGSKAAKRRKSFCARSKNWKGPRGRAARRRWRC
jgi:hypothetical protein|tara:strand:+ start:18 stop:413 length:396 start_codon:yes stop_codon:yes gene_type:complete